MDRKSVFKGLALGTATGLAVYGISKSNMRKRHSIKRNAGKAMKAVGSVIDEITSMMM